MKRINVLFSFLLLGSIFLLASCGGETPSKTVEKYFDGMKEGNGELVYDLILKGEQEITDEEKQEFIKWINKEGPKTMEKLESMEVIGETIAEDGNTAVVKIKVVSKDGEETKEEEEEINLEKKEDGWKVKMF